MDAELISTLYTAYITLAESNLILFQRINTLEERINNIVITGGNSNYYSWQYYSTIR
jgi:hypothetical protein